MANGDLKLPSVRAEGERGLLAGAPATAWLSDWAHGDPPFVGERVVRALRTLSAPSTSRGMSWAGSARWVPSIEIHNDFVDIGHGYGLEVCPEGPADML